MRKRYKVVISALFPILFLNCLLIVQSFITIKTVDGVFYSKLFDYKEPMQGKMVLYRNQSDIYSALVLDDFWDSCEHNPNQHHLIAVDFLNYTAWAKWQMLNENPDTRNYTAAFETLVWVDARTVIGLR